MGPLNYVPKYGQIRQIQCLGRVFGLKWHNKILFFWDTLLNFGFKMYLQKRHVIACVVEFVLAFVFWSDLSDNCGCVLAAGNEY